MLAEIDHHARRYAGLGRFAPFRRLLDAVQAFDGILDIREDRRGHRRDVVAGGISVRTRSLASVYWHPGNERIVRQFVMMLQVAAQPAAAYRQHDIVDRAAWHRVANSLQVVQREYFGIKHLLRRNMAVEARVRHGLLFFLLR